MGKDLARKVRPLRKAKPAKQKSASVPATKSPASETPPLSAQIRRLDRVEFEFLRLELQRLENVCGVDEVSLVVEQTTATRCGNVTNEWATRLGEP
jgi:hypothetical protein